MRISFHREKYKTLSDMFTLDKMRRLGLKAHSSTTTSLSAAAEQVLSLESPAMIRTMALGINLLHDMENKDAFVE